MGAAVCHSGTLHVGRDNGAPRGSPTHTQEPQSLIPSRLPPPQAGFSLEIWLGSKAKPASDFFISPGTEVTSVRWLPGPPGAQARV